MTTGGGAIGSGFARGRLVWVLLLLGSLLQQPGRTTWDTKLDLTADPGSFLTRALSLWNPESSFGELQNQAYGYLFPQGPFFLLGDLLGAPDWVVQRLWSALLLVLAYEGTRLVARALRLPTWAGVVAGLVYALSPRLLGASGVLTGEILPSVLLPWCALPLLLVRSGRMSPRQAGLWSGVAVLCMSGVNAVGTLAVLPLPALLVVEQLRRPHGRRLALWWAGAVAAACTWWLVPLLLLGRYSPPFLDFIETSAATTAPTGWANSVRGADHWLAYYAIGDQAWWPGARLLVTEPWLVLATGVVAAVGLAGLAHRAMPLRRTLLAAAVLGLLCLTAGNPSVLGSLVDGPVRALLDGPLAPLRNVHKVDPLVRLPLALGAGHAVVLAWRAAARHREQLPLARPALVLAAVLALIGSAAPLATGDLRMPGYREVPDAWAQAAAFLDEQDEGGGSGGGGRALVVPGTGFGLQTWGWTIDEPLQGVAGTPWATRSQVPLVPGPTARYLDVVEQRIASGEGSPALADFLARGGIDHVVLRRDLDPFLAETVPSERAELALATSPGLERVASFGATGFGEQGLVDVYSVERLAPTVDLVALDDVVPAATAPDDLLAALELGLLDPDRPTVAADAVDDATGGVLRADGYRRLEREFGRVHDATSQVMSAAEPWRSDRRERDFAAPAGTPRATAELVSGAVVTASSSVGYAEELGPVRPGAGPQAAFDGDLATSWRTGSLRNPVGQWLQADLTGLAGAERADLRRGALSVLFDQRSPGALVQRARVTVETDRGTVSQVVGVAADGRLVTTLPDAEVLRVRVTVVAADGSELAQVVVPEMTLSGVTPGRTTVLPDPLGAEDSLAMRLEPPRRACLDLGFGPVCDDAEARPAEDAGRLDRSITVREAGRWSLSGTVVAAAGPASAALLAPVDGRVSAQADSVLGGDPAVAGQLAVDGDPGTAWQTEPDADRAVLRLAWSGPRTVTGIRVASASSSTSGSAPTTAVLSSGGQRRVVPLAYQSTVEPFVARGRLRIELLRAEGSRGPMAISEIEVEGLEGLAAPPDLTAPSGATCGLGPPVQVDGEVHDTEVVGTVDDVRLGRPMRWEVCDGPVALVPGEHRVVATPTLQFQPVALGWRPTSVPAGVLDSALDSAPASAPAAVRDLDVRRWEPTQRTVEVSAGDASVLRVAENLNDGWVATLDGQPLERVTLDGWQQGYVVPAGEGGVVELSYAPNTTYRAGLVVGGLLAGLLVLATLLGALRERRRRPAAPTSALAAAPGEEPVARLGRPTAIAAGGVLLVAGGPVAAAAYATARWRRAGGWALPVGGALVLLAAALSAWSDGLRFGNPGLAPDGVAAAGVGLLVGVALLDDGSGSAVAPAWRVRSALLAALAWARARPTLLVGLALVAGQAVLRGVVASGSYFWQDDFLHLDLSRTLGLSQEFLVRDYSGHLEPAQYALFWLVTRLGDGAFWPAAVALVALQLVASLLLLAVLRSLFGPSPWVLVPFAAYLFTPLGLATATWFAAGTQALPLQVAMLTAVLGLVRYVRSGRRGWAVLSVVGHAVGLLFWQKTGVVLPLLLGVEVLVLATGLTLRERLVRLARRRGFWLAHLVLLAAYVACYLAVTSRGELGAPADRGLLPTLHDMLLRTLVPGLFGAPWTTEGAGNTIYPDTPLAVQVVTAALLALLVAASLWRGGRAASAGWLLAIGYLAADVVLVLLGRGAYLLLVARDPRYVTDALPVIAIGVCAAFAVAPRRPRTTTPSRWLRLAPWTVLVLVTASALVASVRLAPVTQHPQSEEYVRTVVASLEADPGAAVVVTPIPAEVAVAVNLESLLRAVGHEQALGRPGSRPVLVDPSGRLVPATLVEIDVDVAGPDPDCGWALDDTPRALARLPEPGPGPQLLRLGYVAGAAGVLRVEVDGRAQAVAVQEGVGLVHLDVTGATGTVVAGVEGAGVCVTDLQRGAPVA